MHPVQQQKFCFDARANPCFLLVVPLFFLYCAMDDPCPSSSCSRADTIEPPDSKVHVLNHRNFDRFVKRNPLILMESYGKGAISSSFVVVALCCAAPGSDPFRCCLVLVVLVLPLLLLPRSSLLLFRPPLVRSTVVWPLPTACPGIP